MEARVKWVDGVRFLGESGSGHTSIMEGDPKLGGRNTGPRPMEMILMGMGGCASFDVFSILKKGKQQITDCWVELQAERAEQVPLTFTKIHMQFNVSGHNINEKLVKRAVDLSANKYCSASIMLRNGGVDITHDYTVIEAMAEAEA